MKEYGLALTTCTGTLVPELPERKPAVVVILPGNLELGIANLFNAFGTQDQFLPLCCFESLISAFHTGASTGMTESLGNRTSSNDANCVNPLISENGTFL